MTRHFIKLVLLLTFCCQTICAQEPTERITTAYSIVGCRYWFDSDYTPREAANLGGTSTIDVSQLAEGFHTLHYQAIDSKGEVSPSRTVSFFRYVEQKQDEKFKEYSVQKLKYWFDSDYTPRESANLGGTSTIDVSQLAEGFHTLHYQAVDNKGEVSPSRTVSFFRYVEQKQDEKFKEYSVQKLKYWFDSDYTPRESANLGGTSTIDVSQLAEGFHTLHYQAVDNKGEVSPSRTVSFFRYVEQKQDEKFKKYSVQKVRYWFDDDATNTKTVSYADGIFSIDLSDMSEGTHALYFQLQTEDGELSPARHVDIYRRLYDLYISKQTDYTDSILRNDPLFATRPDLKLHHLPEDISIRGHLSFSGELPLSLGKFVQTGNLGYNHNSNKYTKAGVEYYHPTTLINNGFMRADSVIVKETLYRDRWHFISLPFNVNVRDIDVSNDTYWVLRGYDGEARADGDKDNTWINLQKDDIMEAGMGYILQLTQEGTEKVSELTFKAINDTHKNDIFTFDNVTTTLEEHPSEFAHNRSWNLVGNPYPSFYDTRCIDQNGTIIVWNGNGYTAYSLVDDNYILMPFEAFFIQKPLNAEGITFDKNGRQHSHEVVQITADRRRVASGQHRCIINFKLTDDTDTDCSRVVINENAKIGYETDKDAPKFMEARPQMPQLFSVESGVQYAINERPMGDGQIVFSLYAPTDGECHFSVEGDATDMVVLDTETGASWKMADGDYVFTATEGQHNARLIVSLTGTTTDIAQVNTYDDGEVKVTDGQLSFRFMRNKHIKVFSVDGRMLYDDVASQASIKVARGVYVVDLDGKTTKIMVK